MRRPGYNPTVTTNQHAHNAHNRETGADDRMLNGATFPTTHAALHHDNAAAKASMCECRPGAATLSDRGDCDAISYFERPGHLTYDNSLLRDLHHIFKVVLSLT
jgi:hypothetical protein